MAHKGKLEQQKIINKEIAATKKRLFFNDIKNGLFRWLAVCLPVFTFLILLDIAFEFPNFARIVFLVAFIILTAYFLYIYLIIPVLKLFEIKKGYDKYSIAHKLILDPAVQDKLLTYLELNNIGDLNNYILQAISQKEAELSNLKFNKKVEFKNKKLILRLCIAALLLLITTYIFTGQLFNIATKRLFNPTYKVSYKILNIKILNKNLEVFQNENIEVTAIAKGTYTPEQVFVRVGGKDFYATKTNDSVWTYSFKNVTQNIQFYFHDNLNQSIASRLECIYYPVLKSFDIEITPPKYTEIEPFMVQSAGNFNFPSGSLIKWEITTNNATHGTLFFGNDSVNIEIPKNSFEFEKTFKNGFEYNFKLYNKKTGNKDIYQFYANDIPDQYPVIDVKLSENELITNPVLVDGNIGDDYGFSALNLVLIDTKTGEEHPYPIPFSKNTKHQRFYYQMHLFEICQEQQIESCKYYFAITDNDQTNGNKTSKTPEYEYNIPNKDEVLEQTNEATENIKEKLALGIEMINYLNSQTKDLEKRLKTENLNQWEREQLQNEISQSKVEMNKVLEEIKDMNEKVKSLSKLEKPNNEKIAEKQREIEELLNKLMDDEILNMLKEIEKLKSEMQPNTIKPDSKMNLSTLEEMLERNLETLKRFQIEKGMDEVTNQLQELAKKLQETETAEQREDIEKQTAENFEKHQKLIDDNKDLKQPMNLEDFEQEKSDISNDMKQNDQSPNDKQNNQKTGEKMSKMAQMMQQNIAANFEQTEAEDLENLKQIRSNLLHISFMQEDLADSMATISQYFPEFNRLALKQKNLTDYWTFAKDSINGLVTRNPMLGNMVTKDMIAIDAVNETILTRLFEERFRPMSTLQMQALTHYNNLLLFIDEAIQHAEEQMQNDMGAGCPKPGKGKPSMGDMAKSQSGLKQQLQSLIKQMKEQGKSQGEGSQGMSEQLARYLSQQEQMQKMLGDMMNQGDAGSGTREMLKEINKLMNDNINDILNKSITNQTLLRQEQIVTRLLESEKAEQERKTEEKREARENKIELFSNPKDLKQDSTIEKNFNEIMQYRLIVLKKYYLDLYQNYLNKQQQNN